MEKIVRKILSYNPDESLKPERDEFMANVIALSLFLLEKKGIYSFPNDCAKVIFKKMNDSNAGEYNPFTKSLQYDKDIFMFGDDYTTDLPLLAHEVCHLAQDYSSNGISQENMTYFYPDEFKPLISTLANFNYKKHILNKEEFKEVSTYYDSLYYLQKNEFEAFTFSVEFLNTIIDVANHIIADKKTQLSKEEQDMLFSITYDSYIVPFVNKLMEFKKIRQSKKVAKNIEKLSNSFLTTFFKKHPNWQKEFLNSDINQQVPNTLFSCLIGILTVNYNDQLAHDYFNLLAKSKFDIASQEMIFLVQKTNIQLTKAEEILFNRALKKYNAVCNTAITYDIVKSEKLRVKQENDRLTGTNVM